MNNSKFNICDDILVHIFKFLNIKELYSSICRVNRRFNRLTSKITDPHGKLYRQSCMEILNNPGLSINNKSCMWYYKKYYNNMHLHTEDEILNKLLLFASSEDETNLFNSTDNTYRILYLSSIINQSVRYLQTVNLLPISVENNVYTYEHTFARNCIDVYNNVKVIGQYDQIALCNTEISNNFSISIIGSMYNLIIIKILSTEPVLHLELDCVLLKGKYCRELMLKQVYDNTTKMITRYRSLNEPTLNELSAIVSGNTLSGV
jgi:hypothetical protein